MPKTQRHTFSSANDRPLKEWFDFSLVCGGPLFRIWRRTHLSGHSLEWARRRVLATVAITWVPLLLLSIAEGNAWGRGGAVMFLQDIEMHVRLLIAAPLLILAELKTQTVLPPLVRLFVERRLIPDASRPRFDAAIASAMRLRNSVVAELLLLVLVYAVGVPLVWHEMALDINTWYATVKGSQLQMSLAGWWAALVAMPMFQFLMLRWCFRFCIWARFLWQVSRTKLNLEPTHPDATAGLGFLAQSARAFKIVLVALGCLLAGMMANRIFYKGAQLLEFRIEAAGTVALLLFAILGPLFVFTPQLLAARRKGLKEYGSFGQHYARAFNLKWLRDDRPPDQSLLGSPDIQSLADLRNGYMVVEGMRFMPFGMKTVISLVATMLLPVAPLLLTMFSLEELVDRVLKTLVLNVVGK